MEKIDIKDYNDFRYFQSIKLIRFTIFLGILLFSMFAFMDASMMPLSKNTVYFIRFVIVVPFYLFTMLFTFSSVFKRYYQTFMFLISLFSGYSLLAMIFIAKPEEPGYYFYYNGLFLILTAAPILFRMKVVPSIIAGFLTLIGYPLASILFQNHIEVVQYLPIRFYGNEHFFSNMKGDIVIFNNTAFLFVNYILSNTANYFINYYLKKEYLNMKHNQETNRRLQETDRVKSEFFANISHELRTPLTLVLGPLESFIAGEYGNTLERSDKKITSMYHNSLRLLKLINHLLDIIKLDAGRMQTHSQYTDMGALLNFYVSLSREAAESKNLSLRFTDNINSEENPPYCVWIDRDLFEKAYFNILSNALKFTPPGGKIEIRLNHGPTGFFKISIHDSGIGIHEDMLDKIFERFTQVDSSISRKYEGAGIGLAFVKDIINHIGGKIKVSSRLNRGTRFTLTLPEGNHNDSEQERLDENHRKHATAFSWIKSYFLSDLKPATHKENEPPPVMKTELRTVLVVDDNQDMQQFLKDILIKEFNVITADNGLKGLDAARAHLPDVILSDIMMPELDGYGLTGAVKKDPRLKGIPVIMVTAKADGDMLLQGLEAGADDYLAKPFNARELMLRVKAVLEMKKLRDELAEQNDLLSERKQLLEELVKKQTKIIADEKQQAVSLKEKAEQQLEAFLLVLASAIESKDKYTGGHVERVANYSRDLATKLGLPPEEVREIYLGAIVHDVGKIGIRDVILNKPGKLEPAERGAMQQHPAIGKKLLEGIKDIDVAVTIAFCHQERWDGRGYPNGLKGEEIPLAARIVTIADFWDAIVTDRPYRQAMPQDMAVALMFDEMGQAFDPQLLELFMDVEDKIYLRYIEQKRKKEAS